MSTSLPLLHQLRRQGVHLARSGERLHLEAPPGVLSPALRERLRAHKAALLAHLDAEPAGQVLSAAGMPAPLLSLSLATYHDARYSLRKLPIPVYVHDPRFAVLGLGVHHPDGQSAFHRDARGALTELQRTYGPGLEQVTVVCHNSYLGLYVLGRRHDLHPRHFLDTMLLGHHVHGRQDGGPGQSASLAALAQRHNLAPKADPGCMKGVREPDPQQLADLADGARHDAALIHQLALRLLPRITRPGLELALLQHTVRLFTQRGVHVDLGALARLREAVDAEGRERLAQVGLEASQVTGERAFTTLLGAALGRSGRSLPQKTGKLGRIPATARDDAAMQALAHDADPRVRALVAARLTLKSHDQLQARLATIEAIATRTGGTLPAHLVYCGAHTGRFAGGGGLNLQNLGRSGLGGAVRSLLIPAPGRVFLVADLAQIEARITAWYAGQADLLEGFAQGRDLYSAFAAEVLGTEVRRPGPLDPPEAAARLEALRQTGKQAILGLGFGMGALKYLETLQRDPLTAPLFDRGDLSPARCASITNAYRRRYARIPGLWTALEEAMRSVRCGGAAWVGPLRFEHAGDEVLLWLPSGRALRYPGVRLDPAPRSIRYLDEAGTEAQYVTEAPGLVDAHGRALYGGLLTENLVQATARDLLVEAMLDLEKQGLPTQFHVHDELVLEVPDAEADGALAQVRRRLEQGPAWAPGLPVACEARRVTTYTK